MPYSHACSLQLSYYERCISCFTCTRTTCNSFEYSLLTMYTGMYCVSTAGTTKFSPSDIKRYVEKLSISPRAEADMPVEPRYESRCHFLFKLSLTLPFLVHVQVHTLCITSCFGCVQCSRGFDSCAF